MVPTDENIAFAIQKLSVFTDFPGFPRSKDALEAHARAFLRIVRNKPVNEIVGMTHPSIHGNPLDVDWLIGAALARYDRYPLPLHLRQIYSELLTPENGEAAL